MSQTFKRILCPVDLSSFSLDALKLAVTLAETNDARLDVLHVVHNPFDEIYMSAITQTDPALMGRTRPSHRSGRKSCARPKSTRKFCSSNSVMMRSQVMSKFITMCAEVTPWKISLTAPKIF